jgi:hypothetical protein
MGMSAGVGAQEAAKLGERTRAGEQTVLLSAGPKSDMFTYDYAGGPDIQQVSMYKKCIMTIS